MKITRRLLALIAIFSTPLLLVSAPKSPQKNEKHIAYVGTYTTKKDSKGIYVFEFDPATGKITAPQIAAETQDPSFVVVSADGNFVYAVNEAGKNSMVSAFARDAKTDKLTPLNQMPALGEDPCFISFDKTGKFVLVANYTSGNVVVFPILADGKLGEHTALVTDAGGVGPNKERQEGPHAHWIGASADNRFVFVVDLGLDEVLTYRFDAAKGTLTPGDPANTKLAGDTGPRHLAISANSKFAYSVDELNSTVTAYTFEAAKGSFSVLQTVSTLPPGVTGRNETAEITIHPSRKFLYASNRGHDSIAAFRMDAATGKLTAAGDFSIEGKEPRNFVIDPTGNFVLVGDQLSDKIVVLKIDPATGALSSTGQSVAVPSPVDIAFVGTK
jgi:6-phosphogluconolactonase